MYNGKVTPILREAFLKYAAQFGPDPDEYDEIYYNDMSHDELLDLINTALKTNTEIPYLVD